ncbi:MAG TPA: hypothetical protein DDZ88_08025 [Verrucomicrobiales bacterium]|nr:hypothetical protein [Verrucomicrobiales bacterium]
MSSIPRCSRRSLRRKAILTSSTTHRRISFPSHSLRPPATPCKRLGRRWNSRLTRAATAGEATSLETSAKASNGSKSNRRSQHEQAQLSDTIQP